MGERSIHQFHDDDDFGFVPGDWQPPDDGERDKEFVCGFHDDDDSCVIFFIV